MALIVHLIILKAHNSILPLAKFNCVNEERRDHLINSECLFVDVIIYRSYEKVNFFVCPVKLLKFHPLGITLRGRGKLQPFGPTSYRTGKSHRKSWSHETTLDVRRGNSPNVAVVQDGITWHNISDSGLDEFVFHVVSFVSLMMS